MEYIDAGFYVVILNKINFDGQYVEIFEYPGLSAADGKEAGDYYKFNINTNSCIQAIYPMDIFSKFLHPENLIHQCAWCRRIQLEKTWIHIPFEGFTQPEKFSHGICPECSSKILIHKALHL